MTPAQRIRLARRHGGLSQAALARAVGVQRSAVSHWEGPHAKSPSTGHLCEIAIATAVNLEWLATGRGTMLLSAAAAVCDPGNGIVVEDAQELDLLRAFRDVPLQSRPVLVELAQQLARQRASRNAIVKPTTLMHALRLRLGDDPGPIL